MKSTLFASTLAAALTATSFGQVEVQLIGDCCGVWDHTYVNEILTFDTTNNYGYTIWNIQVPEATSVSFTLSWNDQYGPPIIYDVLNGGQNAGPFASMIDSWDEETRPFGPVFSLFQRVHTRWSLLILRALLISTLKSRAKAHAV